METIIFLIVGAVLFAIFIFTIIKTEKGIKEAKEKKILENDSILDNSNAKDSTSEQLRDEHFQQQKVDIKSTESSLESKSNSVTEKSIDLNELNVKLNNRKYVATYSLLDGAKAIFWIMVSIFVFFLIYLSDYLNGVIVFISGIVGAIFFFLIYVNIQLLQIFVDNAINTQNTSKLLEILIKKMDEKEKSE